MPRHVAIMLYSAVIRDATYMCTLDFMATP